MVNRYTPADRRAVAIIYALAAGSAVKCVVDGGPLAYDAVAALVTLVTLAKARDIHRIPGMLRRSLVPWVLTIGCWIAVVGVVDTAALSPAIVVVGVPSGHLRHHPEPGSLAGWRRSKPTPSSRVRRIDSHRNDIPGVPRDDTAGSTPGARAGAGIRSFARRSTAAT